MCLLTLVVLQSFLWMNVKASPVDSLFYQYKDNFDDEKINSSPSHWIECNTTDNWRVFNDKGNNVYRVNGDTSLQYSWLHLFERDVAFSNRLKIKDKKTSNARVQFSIRYNDEDAQVVAQYRFTDHCWYLLERQGEDFEWIIRGKHDSKPLKLNTWNTIKILAEGRSVKLFVNDMVNPVIATDSIVHVSPGRVALSATGAEAFFDDVALKLLSKQGKVNEGVLEYNLNKEDGIFREGASIVEKRNGDLLLLHRWEEYLSANKGQSFIGPKPITWPYNGHAHHNVIRLKSGKLLKMVAEYNTKRQGFDTPLRFRSKISADDGNTWFDGGLTWSLFRVGVGGKSDAIVMNDKLSQMPNGRVFFVLTVRKHDGEKVTGHKAEVYYTDDEGASWKKSLNDTDTLTKLKHYTEGKVMYTTDGKLRLYIPWNESPTVRYSESADNGLTWAGDFPVENLKNSRSSFALVEDTYAKTPTFYMVWVFDDKNRSNVIFLPRSRLGLARSHDGKNWEYMMDVERWVSPDNRHKRSIVQILDPSLTATKDHLYITIGRSEKALEGNGHNAQRLRVYRIEKSKMQPYPAFPTDY